MELRPLRNILFHTLGVAFLAIIMSPSMVVAQGSIFGQVTNSDASIPAESELSFFGYLDDTDEEIRIESSVGAGFDAGNWFDDFQNYLTEAPGNPYDYHFYNTANGEGFVLSGAIPNNSYQQEDISLASVDWPQTPSGLSGKVISYSEVVLNWFEDVAVSYHVYRRMAPSYGSFFRIDDPLGLPDNPGVIDSFYIDTTVDSGGVYEYMIIARDASMNLSPHSEIITIDVSDVVFLRGDSNGDGIIDIGDCPFTISYLYRGGPPPAPLDAGDANCDGLVNLGDVVYTINYIFKEGPTPDCP